MKSSQLRDLAREFSSGKISEDDYHARRRKLIDGIVAGGIAIQYREIKPVTAFAKPLKNQKLIFAGAAALMVVLVVSVVALIPSREPPVVAVRAAPEPSPAELAIKGFLGTDDWSEESLTTFETDWSSFSEFHKEAVRRTPGFSRLETQLRNRVKEQHTLAQIGDDLEAGLREMRLMMFAERLNITL
ncbi:MAG: hypothetical protein V3T39_09175 [Gammaproteobacteria bacterium]